MTLLEMTQNILSATDGDEVNSINDTVEAYQVATVLKETYYEIIDNLSIPGHEGLIQLDALADVDKPNYLKLPANVDNIKWVRYDAQTDSATAFYEVVYMTPEQFVNHSMARAGQDNTVEIEDFSDAKLWIGTNQNPTYWTTFDNLYLVFDSYDVDLDTTLQNSKTMCWGQTYPAFTMEDDFIPNLEANMFSMYLSEAKSVCFFNQKQMLNQKEEQRSRRQRVRSQSNRWKMDQRRPYDGVDYGRRRPG